jgi:hypothetical protein
MCLFFARVMARFLVDRVCVPQLDGAFFCERARSRLVHRSRDTLVAMEHLLQ